jgi:hypothetical protein
LSPTWRYSAIGLLIVLVIGVVAVIAVRTVDRPPTALPPAPAPAPAPPGPPKPPTQLLYVNPTGTDTNPGTADAPFQTIQAALEKATPGTLITLAAGVYHENPVTVADGAPDAPITIKGPETGKDRAGRYQATLYGTGRIFSINNSYYTLDGFTIDGQEALANTPFPTDLAAVDAFKTGVQATVEDGRLVYVGADDATRDLTGITINNMFLSGSGGECVRLRNDAHDNTITDSVIQYCGMHGKGDDDKRAEFHNGEGVYIGTSPDSDEQPMHDNDGSSGNLVARNTIRTFGSECFDVKENAHNNTFEDNVCSDNTEAVGFDGSNIELRGFQNVVRGNQISDSAGYTVKISVSDDEYDKGGNVVEDNHLSNSAVAVKVEAKAAQGAICGNVVTGIQALVDIDDDADFTADITAPC